MVSGVDFPNDLPFPTLQGNAQTLSPHFRRVEVAEGLPFYRDLPTPYLVYTVRWLFNARQHNLFVSWYQSELEFNSFFNIDLLLGDVATFDTGEGDGYLQNPFKNRKTRCLAHFQAPYEDIRDQQGLWTVTAVLDVRLETIPDRGIPSLIYNGGDPENLPTDILASGSEGGLDLPNDIVKSKGPRFWVAI